MGHSIVGVGIKTLPREGNILWSEKDEIQQNHALLSQKAYNLFLKVWMQSHKATHTKRKLSVRHDDIMILKWYGNLRKKDTNQHKSVSG